MSLKPEIIFSFFLHAWSFFQIFSKCKTITCAGESECTLVQMIKYAVQELQTEQLFDCLYYQIYVLL